MRHDLPSNNHDTNFGMHADKHSQILPDCTSDQSRSIRLDINHELPTSLQSSSSRPKTQLLTASQRAAPSEAGTDSTFNSPKAWVHNPASDSAEVLSGTSKQATAGKSSTAGGFYSTQGGVYSTHHSPPESHLSMADSAHSEEVQRAISRRWGRS